MMTKFVGRLTDLILLDKKNLKKSKKIRRKQVKELISVVFMYYSIQLEKTMEKLGDAFDSVTRLTILSNTNDSMDD